MFIFRDVFTRILFTVFSTNNISITQIDPKLPRLLKLSKSYRILHLMHEVGFPLHSILFPFDNLPGVGVCLLRGVRWMEVGETAMVSES